MSEACDNARNMKMIQIRNVPDDVHQALKERAARERTTLSNLLLVEAERLARYPTPEEMRERLSRRTPVSGPSGAELVREDRDIR